MSYRFLYAAGMALFVGTIAGFGIVYHDGRAAIEGLIVGLASGAAIFMIIYVRLLRRLAELLSAIH